MIEENSALVVPGEAPSISRKGIRLEITCADKLVLP